MEETITNVNLKVIAFQIIHSRAIIYYKKQTCKLYKMQNYWKRITLSCYLGSLALDGFDTRLCKVSVICLTVFT